MNNQKPDIFKPALIGGVVIGLLSGLPVIQLGNCFCCLWVLVGAALSAYLLSKESPVKVKGGDGAIVGMFAGIIGAIISSLINLPFRALNQQIVARVLERLPEYGGEFPQDMDLWLKRGAEFSLPMFMFGLVISVIIYALFGALGGIIGVSLFGKKKAPEETPPQVSSQEPKEEK
ncbi:hypothetical protein NLC82_05225 [Candidatus Aminicenantes bacterium AC-335-A11]|jgi:hypothetical protein|nr:hypothetical protein [SCandidatus Aminicenantes bacterium Aminicenantia_JdfR_composite]MCP2598010.1 hypothetical protein [Candidatus Aminicenantes bacterium AC-335-L06]MCP2606163.1 hypothetical protein [Candidatus Aminicenantes bacterium AC-708-I09]MCP2618806.1 hypothetical protein [Candidatus Aminicenantes bacterium AC-335-A11]